MAVREGVGEAEGVGLALLDGCVAVEEREGVGDAEEEREGVGEAEEDRVGVGEAESVGLALLDGRAAAGVGVGEGVEAPEGVAVAVRVGLGVRVREISVQANAPAEEFVPAAQGMHEEAPALL